MKMRLLGILPEQLKEIEESRKTSTYLTIYAPIGGTVIEKSVRSGQYVKEGDMLYRIADLDPIWLYLDIYEYDLAWVRYGQSVTVTLEAYPTETFQGVVTFIDPFLDDKTRTVRARVNLKNPDRKLKPAMYASALIRVKLMPVGRPSRPDWRASTSARCTPKSCRTSRGAAPSAKCSWSECPKPPTQQPEGVRRKKATSTRAMTTRKWTKGSNRLAYSPSAPALFSTREGGK
ncbi:MAG: efflux RND transporter periplasmic adaptor subunit [Bryobacteraceae bacterium]|nr:efflux RND transporter periplasmic adaptor subunit [Bryobacteraceae bacterium]